MTTSDTKKPSKKRKLDDSPPWKSATTQTPTAFIIDGRRKSGRTNPIPFELLPPPKNGTPTPTRGSAATGGGSSAGGRGPHRQAAPQQQSNDVSTARTAARSTSKASSSRQATGKATRLQSPIRTLNRVGKSSTTTTRSPTVRKRAQSKTTPTKTTSARSKPSPAIGTRKSARALKKAVAAAEEELAGSKYRYGDVNANGLSDGGSSFDSDGELDPSLKYKLPKVKLKLKFGLPKPVITHPGQIPPPKPFASFEEFLQQDDLERNPALLLEAQGKAREEALLRSKIEYEARFGALTRENCSLFIPETQVEPDQQYGHQDHLVAHALNFSKLMMKERKEHQELMKKRNAALMAEVRRRRPRTREEIEQEEYIENRKLYKEQTAQLRRKWDEVIKASRP